MLYFFNLMKRISKLVDSFLPILPYLIVCIFSLYQPADPDLGWHLKYGEYFWQHGTVLRDNTFSTMMPNYHWANTSWLTDIISYTTFHLGGFFGISLLAALVVTMTCYFFAKAARLTLWEQTLIFPFVLYLENPINSVSFRGQQLSTMFVGVLFYLISRYEKKPKILWLVIPLFWIWSAVDGEFLLGFALFVLWIGLTIMKKMVRTILSRENIKRLRLRDLGLRSITQALISERKEIGVLGLYLIGSLLVTLINPFGYGIYLDAFSHIGNPLLKDIDEYLPFVMFSLAWWNEIIVGIILIFGLFILYFREKFWQLFPILGGGLLLFLLSLHVSRYAWPSYFMLFPLLAMAAGFLKPDGKKMTKITTGILLMIFLTAAIWLRYPFTKYTGFGWAGYCQIQVLPCSPVSAKFLLDHHLNHNLYSLYGWGGWLIWNYPRIKPTIDGRMHLWVQNGYSGFVDYFAVEQNESDIDKTKYSVAYMSPSKPVYNRLVQLAREGKWKEVYQDKDAGIFVRVK
jgi:hypothetical protein